MNSTSLLDGQVIRLGYWSVIVVISIAVVCLFLPLDAPADIALHTLRDKH
ncbi:MAG: hypothetical protein HOL98_16465 [Gammaproteobacteria bacterium]|nr:hypothetical protein [Gammaproteobacteria bacterium]MBT5205055.1 hypothetical protein [Gammaproteobacteria bacterium]MBT5600912.1 hypothetical protein [Gammaproteobacteria bacterium]MBT6244432.1 hypothetical protein [Gammaproteobacteria bacterium]